MTIAGASTILIGLLVLADAVDANTARSASRPSAIVHATGLPSAMQPTKADFMRS